ncbi:DMT family transporter [Chloroflexi bacterium TSY]|nr:DMT family transporter [Chloroflexi bacterium TSY]
MKLQLSPYAKGLLITALGVVIISPDGLLTRLIGTDPWTYAFWRGLLFGLAIWGGIFAIHRHKGWSYLTGLGWPGLLFALIFSSGSILFVYAFTTTTIANTLFIVSTSPVFTALIGHYFLHDLIPMRTYITICVVLIGIAIIAFAGGTNSGHFWGNWAALGTALTSAINFSLTRRFRHIDMVPAVGAGGLLSVLLTFPLAEPLSIAPAQWPYLLFLGLFILPASFSLIFIGPRYVPAAEVNLMTLLEAILGPLLVWWAIGESLGIHTLIGGTIIITALALNTAIPLLSSRHLESPLDYDSVSID